MGLSVTVGGFWFGRVLLGENFCYMIGGLPPPPIQVHK